jgi:dolichol kinase
VYNPILGEAMALANEIRRKGIHLIGLVVPLLYWSAGKLVTLSFIAFWTILFIAGEIYRFRRGIPREIEEVAAPMMRERERSGVGGHVFFALGLFIAVFLYERDIAIAISLIMVLADGAAAIVGKSFGRVRLIGEKTLEGTLTLICVAFIVAILFVSWAVALVGAAVAGFVELMPGDDNLSIPIFSGLAMAAMRYFL